MPEPCECPMRKALEGFLAQHDRDCEAPIWAPICGDPIANDARAALSAPCPCERLLEEKATADGFPPEDDRAMEEQMSRAYIETLEAERDKLREELAEALEALRGINNFAQVFAVLAKHGITV